ncbi:MAG: hypothetical protein WCK91_03105 [bacterium]
MIRVGVLRGGKADSFESSLASGGVVLSVLQSEPYNSKYKPIDILVDQDGVWHVGGVSVSMDKVLHFVDVVVNMLGNDYGSDGKVSQILQQWSIPHTGSSPMVSAIAHNLILAKDEFSKLGLKTPQHLLFEAYLEELDGSSDAYPARKAQEVFHKMPPPWIARPFTRGSSMGIHVCKTLPELIRAFEVGMNERVSVLVEELIEGKSASVSVLNNFRGQSIYPFLCLGNFSTGEKREAERLAQFIHDKMHLSHFSQSDFIITPKKGIYVLGLRTLPELHADSDLHDHLESVGVPTHELVDHLIRLALGHR